MMSFIDTSSLPWTLGDLCDCYPSNQLLLTSVHCQSNWFPGLVSRLVQHKNLIAYISRPRGKQNQFKWKIQSRIACNILDLVKEIHSLKVMLHRSFYLKIVLNV